MQNHVIDPTYFYDCIEEFSFDYDIFVLEKITVDDAGRDKEVYSKTKIRGSLQSQGLRREHSKSGNQQFRDYNFYCKSLYRIDINDVIHYKGNYYETESVQDYDEYGVRSCSLKMITLSSKRDLADYVKYLSGEKLV